MKFKKITTRNQKTPERRFLDNFFNKIEKNVKAKTDKELQKIMDLKVKKQYDKDVGFDGQNKKFRVGFIN